MYIFNPEHDLCLANGDIHFVPPESALAFGRDCASIIRFMRGLDADADVNCSVDTCNGMNSVGQVKKIVPWGWNSVLKERLLKEGYSPDLLPTELQIAQITELSHRSVALEALEYLHGAWCKEGNGDLWQKRLTSPDYRIAAKSLEEVTAFLEKVQNVVLKAPLSGSGKGIRFVSKELSHSDAGWCRNLIAKHGYVVVEQRFAPVMEFAMLFRSVKVENNSENGEKQAVEFIGYSLFYTQNGAYRGNILASNEFIESQITQYIPVDLLHKSRLAIMDFIEKRIAGKYEGFIGVDQFVCRDFVDATNTMDSSTGLIAKENTCYKEDESHYCFNPVVEINLRMTMGLVARNIYDRFSLEYGLQDGSHIFEICRNEPERGRYSYKITEHNKIAGNPL